MKRLSLVFLCAAALVLALPAAAQALTFNKAVDKLVRHGYSQRLERAMIDFRSTPLGFRWAGSSADNAAAQYMAAQMTAAGLVNVKLEPVPVDAWTFEGASIRVGGKTMQATSYPGVPPTPAEGVSGQVVIIPGAAAAADFAAAGDVNGKIVVINFDSSDWWLNFPAAEAGVRGAKAVVLIYSKKYPGYHGAPNAFGSNDPGYTFTSPPIVWLPSQSATWLKKQVAKRPTIATVTLRASFKMADFQNVEAGGVAYNVVGEYPGASTDGKKIVLGSHHDSHFTGALDNVSACVAQLTIAKAMKMSGYKPAHTVVFLSTTAEEWGYTDCNYDWLVGSTYSIQHTHPDWGGNVLAMLNMELLGYKAGHLWYTASPELKPWIVAEMKAHPNLVGGKGAVYTPDDSNNGLWFSYNDQWPLAASGIPGACAWTPTDYFWSHYYHTNYDNITKLSYSFLAKNVKFQFELARSIDGGLLPYRLSAQASPLAKMAKGDFAGEGVDATAAGDFQAAAKAYAAAAARFDARRRHVKVADVAAANEALLGIEKKLNSNLTALDVWDDTIYPFQQSMVDLVGMNGAVKLLSKSPADYAGALEALGSVNLTWYGSNFSDSVYRTNLLQREPTYPKANMAVLGHMAMTLDVMPEYRDVLAKKDVAPIVASLKAKIVAEAADVASRLKTLTTVLTDVTAQIESITP
jgi:Peptidase family M28